MSFQRPLVLAAALLYALSCFAAGSTTTRSNRTYMWIDKNGVRQYGDAVPPEYAQTEHRVLNSQGVQTVTEGARKNAEQLAAEQHVLDEKRDREQHDKFLLNTYASTRDIERLRDERLQQLEGQIRATTAYVETLDSRLAALAERTMMFKPYNGKPTARRMPDDVAEQLVRASNEVAAQRKSVEKQRHDVQEVRARFDDDIVRYRELTTKIKSG